MEPEPSPSEKNHSLWYIQKRVRERERNRLRARLRVQHRCDDGRCSRVGSAAGRCICRCARFTLLGLPARCVVVGDLSAIAGSVGVLMTVVVGGLGVGARLRGVRGTRERASG